MAFRGTFQSMAATRFEANTRPLSAIRPLQRGANKHATLTLLIRVDHSDFGRRMRGPGNRPGKRSPRKNRSGNYPRKEPNVPYARADRSRLIRSANPSLEDDTLRRSLIHNDYPGAGTWP